MHDLAERDAPSWFSYLLCHLLSQQFFHLQRGTVCAGATDGVKKRWKSEHSVHAAPGI